MTKSPEKRKYQIAEKGTSEQFADVLNTKEAARFLGCALITLYKAVKKKTIPHHKLFGKLRFKKSELEAWIQKNLKK